MTFEQRWQDDNRQPHADDPSDTQLDQIGDCFFLIFHLAKGKVMDRTDKLVIKPHNKGHRTAGYTGNAVRQRHTKASNCFFNHEYPPKIFVFQLHLSQNTLTTGSCQPLAALRRYSLRNLYAASQSTIKYCIISIQERTATCCVTVF